MFKDVAYGDYIATIHAKARPEGRFDSALAGSISFQSEHSGFCRSTVNYGHWIVNILGGAVFAFGQMLLFTSLVDDNVAAYTVYAAATSAANDILRGHFGAAMRVHFQSLL